MANFESELLHIFQGIFDEVWAELGPSIPQHAHDDRRSELARRIVLAHRRGLRPDHIKAEVLDEMKPYTG